MKIWLNLGKEEVLSIVPTTANEYMPIFLVGTYRTIMDHVPLLVRIGTSLSIEALIFIFIRFNTTRRLFWCASGSFSPAFCFNFKTWLWALMNHVIISPGLESSLIPRVLNSIPWFFVLKSFIDIQSSFSCVIRITFDVYRVPCHEICPGHCISR